ARASRQSTSSVGRLKHIDLPEAVPVVTIVGPSQAAWSASAWWEYSRLTPVRASAASTSGCSSGGGCTNLARPGPSRASRTSRPSACPSSSSALQGSAVRSRATGCDSRRDVPPARAPPRGSRQRASRSTLSRRRRRSRSRAAGSDVSGDDRLRCLYLDLDGTLLGAGASLLHDGQGAGSLPTLHARAACL